MEGEDFVPVGRATVQLNVNDMNVLETSSEGTLIRSLKFTNSGADVGIMEVRISGNFLAEKKSQIPVSVEVIIHSFTTTLSLNSVKIDAQISSASGDKAVASLGQHTFLTATSEKTQVVSVDAILGTGADIAPLHVSSESMLKLSIIGEGPTKQREEPAAFAAWELRLSDLDLPCYKGRPIYLRSSPVGHLAVLMTSSAASVSNDGLRNYLELSKHVVIPNQKTMNGNENSTLFITYQLIDSVHIKEVQAHPKFPALGTKIDSNDRGDSVATVSLRDNTGEIGSLCTCIVGGLSQSLNIATNFFSDNTAVLDPGAAFKDNFFSIVVQLFRATSSTAASKATPNVSLDSSTSTGEYFDDESIPLEYRKSSSHD